MYLKMLPLKVNIKVRKNIKTLKKKHYENDRLKK